MDARQRVWTILVGLLVGLVGFVVGGMVAGWLDRDGRAEPWRQMRIDHEGAAGQSTRTRAIFDSPKVALQGVEVQRTPEGQPEAGNVEIRGGAELGVTFGADGRPHRLEAPDGSAARLTFGSGSKVRVTFEVKGQPAGETVIPVPVVMQPSLKVALADVIIGVAHAQAGGGEAPKQVDVRREVAIPIDIRLGPGGTPGQARVETSCAPYACTPLPPKINTPGPTRLRIAVSAQQPRGPAPADASAIAPFRDVAKAEASTAGKVLPDIAMIVSAVGVVTEACEKLKRPGPLCVAAFRRPSNVGGAIHAILEHEVPKSGPLLDARATTLFHQEQARAALDKELTIEVCFARSGYTRICTKLKGRPFGPTPMTSAGGTFEMKRGISGTVEGSHVITQSDGADCKFSPSPRTEGPLTLSFDSRTGQVKARFSANAKGTRAGLACSLGSGDMRWTQNYGANLTQSMAPSQLQAGGSISLNLRGTMTGSGSTSQSNCRTKAGASASCPAGRNQSYNYPVEIRGTFNLDNETGNGTITVNGAPLATGGSWQIPAAP